MSNYLNIKTVLDVQSQLQAIPQARRDFSIPVFVFKGAEYSGSRANLFTGVDDVIDAYGSNTEQAKAAATFFAGGFNGLHPTNLYIANFDSGSESWSTVVSELLADPSYYGMAIDNTFSESENKVLSDAIAASTKRSYHGYFLDMNPIAASTTLANDTTSMTKYFYNAGYEENIIFYDLAANADQYLQVGAMSYFSVVNFTAARPLGSLAFKDPDLDVSDITDAYATNLMNKNANFYAAFGEEGRNIFYKGVSSSGRQTNVQIGANWLDYNMTYDIFDFMKSIEQLQYTNGDFSKLKNVISGTVEKAKAFGLVAPGTDSTTGIQYPTGYSIFIPSPSKISAADKALGVLPDIVVTAIIGGSVVKFEITNKLNY